MITSKDYGLFVYVVVDSHGEIPAVFEFMQEAVDFVNKSGKVYRIVRAKVQ